MNTLKRQAVRTARLRRLEGVILGHTHVAFDSIVDGVHYVNGGCWTEQPNGFVGIRDGAVRAYHWQAGICLPLGEAALLSPTIDELAEVATA